MRTHSTIIHHSLKKLINTNTEEEDEEDYLVRDAARIDLEKFNLWESRHAMKISFKNLPDQDKLSTAYVIIKLLNPHPGKFCKEINSKHLKLSKQIAYCER